MNELELLREQIGKLERRIARLEMLIMGQVGATILFLFSASLKR